LNKFKKYTLQKLIEYIILDVSVMDKVLYI